MQDHSLEHSRAVVFLVVAIGAIAGLFAMSLVAEKPQHESVVMSAKLEEKATATTRPVNSPSQKVELSPEEKLRREEGLKEAQEQAVFIEETMIEATEEGRIVVFIQGELTDYSCEGEPGYVHSLSNHAVMSNSIYSSASELVYLDYDDQLLEYEILPQHFYVPVDQYSAMYRKCMSKGPAK